MKMKKYIPNMLSISRILFASSLFFFTGGDMRNKIVFTVIYCLISVTDMLDGFLARRLHAQSKWGAKLDGLGDLAMFIVGFICLMFLMRLDFGDRRAWALGTLGVGIALKAFSFVLTRVRFKEWNMMHTHLNKFLGAALYLAVPIFLWMGEINFWVVLAFVLVAALSVAEDTYILCTSSSYNANHRGIVAERFWPKHKEEAKGLTA